MTEPTYIFSKEVSQLVNKELRVIEKSIGSTDIRDISRALTSVWKLKKLFLASK